MNENRYSKSARLVIGLIFLCAAPGATHAQIASPGPMPMQKVGSSSPQRQKISDVEDDFAGLAYSDDQKSEIDKIHQNTKSHQDVVAKDTQLNGDQRDAMLLGYTRMEYGEIYKVLTPEQKRQVQQKIRARRADQEAAKRHQVPVQK
ncbi:MAG TPA: hypothetical protein VK709_17660 [Candidatus Saccharimonadales bacterium]|jgi:Spy/CpxP family protein refolding chaperone|nr:hypothetical protein [Candidatus Saccharimonadales bacterium]